MGAVTDSRPGTCRPAVQAGGCVRPAARKAKTTGAKGRRIRVALVQENALARAGLRMLIESRGRCEVVAEAELTFEARAVILDSRPDVIVIDADSASEIRLELIPRLIGKGGDRPRVLVLTAANDREVHARAVRLGATGVTLKKASVESFLKAIEGVHTGEVWLSRSAVARLLQDRSSAETPEPSRARNGASSLSPREREVAALVRQGLRNSEVARRLFISTATVRHHLTSIFTKLHVTGRYGLFALDSSLEGEPSSSPNPPPPSVAND